jgi:hypothetical protein
LLSGGIANPLVGSKQLASDTAHLLTYPHPGIPMIRIDFNKATMQISTIADERGWRNWETLPAKFVEVI